MSTPIEQTVANWHRLLRGDLPGGLDAILHDEVVFLSPIVFTPQRGKDLTKLYLQGAFASFGGDGDGGGPGEGGGGGLGSADAASTTSFHYVKEVLSGDHAVLEFETTVQGTLVNGVDIITVDADGKIIEFKVMLRPLKAIELMHQMMKHALETLGAAGADD